MDGAPGTSGTHVQGHVGHLGMVKMDLAESAPPLSNRVKEFSFSH